MTIGENIKRIRERNNLTQKQLAYLSHISEGMINNTRQMSVHPNRIRSIRLLQHSI